MDSKPVDIYGELLLGIETGGYLVKTTSISGGEGLVVPLIRGADLLARLGEVTF